MKYRCCRLDIGGAMGRKVPYHGDFVRDGIDMPPKFVETP
jgi:hypothetical protein